MNLPFLTVHDPLGSIEDSPNPVKHYFIADRLAMKLVPGMRDLDWNPSGIEQRTDLIDRSGCKAEGKHPIAVFLPYLAGKADERQYRVMTEREKWFRIVMGQEKVAELIPESDDVCRPQPPEEFQKMLVFDLGVC